jgi:hypothetical protein
MEVLFLLKNKKYGVIGALGFFGFFCFVIFLDKQA